MARFKEHCADCEQALGQPFEHVHAWLDELQPEYGPMHRPFRHHTDGVELEVIRKGFEPRMNTDRHGFGGHSGENAAFSPECPPELGFIRVHSRVSRFKMTFWTGSS